MPNPQQTRASRINQLVKEFESKVGDNITFDPIYLRGLEMFPMVTKNTIRDYARATLFIILQRKKNCGK